MLLQKIQVTIFNPGDIIEIDSAPSMGRTYIYLAGLRGSVECPIIIKNKGFGK